MSELSEYEKMPPEDKVRFHVERANSFMKLYNNSLEEARQGYVSIDRLLSDGALEAAEEAYTREWHVDPLGAIRAALAAAVERAK